MNNLVSVLIAAFRAQEFITRPVASVLEQSYPFWEIIIASDDREDYRKILQQKGIDDPRIRYASTGKVGAGPSAARNAALDMAQGDIMAVLDADDAFAPDKLEKLLPFVLKHGAATSDVRIIKSVTAKEFPSLARKFPAGLLSPQDYICANIHTFSMLLWDRRRVEARWDSAIPCLEDLVHGLCVYNGLDGIYYDPAPLHSYYKHENSITNQTSNTNQSDTALQMIASCQDLIARAGGKNFPIGNEAARSALIRYVTALLALEKQFFDEPVADPVMGYYYFLQRNAAAFYNW